MRRPIIPYDRRLTERARQLRNNCTRAERRLWRRLKGTQIRGYDFHRQRPIGHFIVDFFCCELALAIEVDGSSHNGRFEQDRIRQQWLEGKGVFFLRFTNDQVFYNLGEVVATIESWIDQHDRKRKDPSDE